MTKPELLDDFDGPEGMEKVIAVLTAGHLEGCGGYPYDWRSFGGRVVIATIDHDGATKLDDYGWSELLDWEIRANKLKKKYPEEPWSFAVYESREVL